ncbi:MAG: hypothetical protein NC177_09560 [Ruminococcus flavefaciens]|nr:hypothetical protein [Ruminococcus flavefaciens]
MCFFVCLCYKRSENQAVGADNTENNISTNKLGQELSEFTPVEIVGYEVAETGSPLALDNG